ncbi:hypothetical protein ABE219_08835 [Bacillus paranthracis]|uniref:hypothetical protein n=1 Tax=Bacillus paranthracis TaxID=2026186 RepID=UPI0010FF6928|nr:hypothetical protein [Bacillus paranthracis]MED1348506.1 hypothetical protein [Bacillus paranthracis]MED1416956.1 hypothetical protein [Bacillus paranthracis]QCU08631.1 hypothetical protein BCPR1_02175 [Bacillus paranthracis]
MKWPTDSSHWSWIIQKAKVARSECEVDGASDLEALFASREEAKPPNILATEAGFQQKAKVVRSECEVDGASDLEALFASLRRSEAAEHSSHQQKRKSLAFHQSEAILFLLTLFLFLLESWYVFEECFFLLAVTLFFP